MKWDPRHCPVCDAREKRLLFRQSFGTFSQDSLLDGFDLVVCARCGAGYADDVPPQEAFDRYYAEMSKYEYTDRAGIPSNATLGRYRDMADVMAPYLGQDDRLLDIGCATGGLLAEFKRRGYANLIGVDPSPICAQLTRQLHGIEAAAATLSKLPQLGERADMVVLTGVLEHLRDLDVSLDNVKSCLREGGLLYIEVPDAARYDHHFSAPFQLFSMEHVNYFSPVSLGNLMARYGFSVVVNHRVVRQLSAQADEPAVGALFRRDTATEGKTGFDRDDETEPALNRYIQQSLGLERQVQQKITALADSGKPLAVWGVGTHTLRLLETSDLPRANITAFIDSNVHYQGKRLAGLPVVAPSGFKDETSEILISSQTAEAEIFHLIREKLGWPNVVHRLYSE